MTHRGKMMSEPAKCELCGEPMPLGEQMFKFHGYSGPCPKEPLPKPDNQDEATTLRNALKAVLMFHSGEPWTQERQWEWKAISAGRECTTKVLCDIVREALSGNPR